MKFRLSSLLSFVAVVALLVLAFLQWHHADSLQTKLDAEKLKNRLMMNEVRRLGN